MNQATLAETRKEIRSKKIRLPDHLSSRSVLYVAAYAACPFLLIGMSVVLGRLATESWFVLLPAHFVLLLAAQRCFQTLVHDASHRLYSEKSLARNDLLANLLAAGWIGSTVDAYRKVHFRHHAHNGSEDDPEHIDFDAISERGGLKAYCFRYIFCLEVLRLFRKYYWPESTTNSEATRSADRHAAEHQNSGFARLVAKIVATILTKSHVLITQFVLASVFVFVSQCWPLYFLWLYIAVSWSPMISGLRFLVEHPGKSDLTVTTKSWLLELLYFAPFNFNYHFEHHLWPSVPPYRLRRAHQYLQSQNYFSEHPECLNFNKSYLRSLWSRGK